MTAGLLSYAGPRQRRVFVPLLVALVVLAWAALWVWSRSPYGGYLGHELALGGPAAELCRALPGGTVLIPALLYAGAWTVMTCAMMLPATLPLFAAFERVTWTRADRGRLMALLVLGYAGVWSGFGLVAHGAQLGVQALFARAPGWAAGDWIVTAGVLGGAGAFQFSALKYRCLERCRRPLGFVIGHWRGRTPSWDALRLGAHHGLFCVGCCWALMLLMFVFGTGSLGAMLMPAAVMAVEKNARWGRLVPAPLGVALLGASLFVVVRHAG